MVSIVSLEWKLQHYWVKHQRCMSQSGGWAFLILDRLMFWRCLWRETMICSAACHHLKFSTGKWKQQLKTIWKHLSLSNLDEAYQLLCLKLTFMTTLLVCVKHDTESVVSALKHCSAHKPWKLRHSTNWDLDLYMKKQYFYSAKLKQLDLDVIISISESPWTLGHEQTAAWKEFL